MTDEIAFVVLGLNKALIQEKNVKTHNNYAKIQKLMTRLDDATLHHLPVLGVYR